MPPRKRALRQPKITRSFTPNDSGNEDAEPGDEVCEVDMHGNLADAEHTPKRKVGRPRKDLEPAPDITKEELPEYDFSVTIAKGKVHVPPIWLQMMLEFFEHHGIKGSLSLERGGKQEMLHIQAVITMRILIDDATLKRFKKMLKDALGVRHGDGCGV